MARVVKLVTVRCRLQEDAVISNFKNIQNVDWGHSDQHASCWQCAEICGAMNGISAAAGRDIAAKKALPRPAMCQKPDAVQAFCFQGGDEEILTTVVGRSIRLD